MRFCLARPHGYQLLAVDGSPPVDRLMVYRRVAHRPMVFGGRVKYLGCRLRWDKTFFFIWSGVTAHNPRGAHPQSRESGIPPL